MIIEMAQVLVAIRNFTGNNMKANYIGLVGASALLTALAGAANAEDLTSVGTSAAVPLARAQVKSEARAAEQAGAIPRGQQSFSSPPSSGSNVDRTALAVETAAYTKAKQPVWLPSNGSYYQGNTMHSTANRADVKAETMAAVKNQEIPRGEAQSRKIAQ